MYFKLIPKKKREVFKLNVRKHSSSHLDFEDFMSKEYETFYDFTMSAFLFFETNQTAYWFDLASMRNVENQNIEYFFMMPEKVRNAFKRYTNGLNEKKEDKFKAHMKKDFGTFQDFCLNAFSFYRTREGSEYWYKIANK